MTSVSITHTNAVYIRGEILESNSVFVTFRRRRHGSNKVDIHTLTRDKVKMDAAGTPGELDGELVILETVLLYKTPEVELNLSDEGLAVATDSAGNDYNCLPDEGFTAIGADDGEAAAAPAAKSGKAGKADKKSSKAEAVEEVVEDDGEGEPTLDAKKATKMLKKLGDDQLRSVAVYLEVLSEKKAGKADTDTLIAEILTYNQPGGMDDLDTGIELASAPVEEEAEEAEAEEEAAPKVKKDKKDKGEKEGKAAKSKPEW